MSVNFSKNQGEITKAWRDVSDNKNSPNWALFGYEGSTNNIKLMSTGSNGLKGLVSELNCSLIQYAFCRVLDESIGLNKLVLINWQGDSSPLSRKGLCASHVGDVVNYFKGCTQTITIRNDDEATEEYLMDQIVKSSSSRVNLAKTTVAMMDRTESNATQKEPTSSLANKKTDITSEIQNTRKSFWQQQEEEEKLRIQEEKKRAAEKQAQFERERKLREEAEAKKLAEKIKERERLIDATRQAEKANDQHSSSSSSGANQDDDERVGRRSELIRLERNQETLSLISKGSIKSKRAIFEQASQQQNQQPSTLVRRPSGAMVSQRLNAFQSLDYSSTASSSSNEVAQGIDKVTNGFAKSVSITEPKPIVKEIETIVVSQEPQLTEPSVNSNQETIDKQPSKVDITPVKDVKKEDKQIDSPGSQNNSLSEPQVHERNNNETQPEKSPKRDNIHTSPMVFRDHDIRAKAMYDYTKADNTEISFDPDDIIGNIEKVDVGWWHGKVLTGKYQGQCGLFPANYVEELSAE